MQSLAEITTLQFVKRHKF